MKTEKLRRYGKWAGRPEGALEDPERCCAEVFPRGSYIARQCLRKRDSRSELGLCQRHEKERKAGRHINIPEPE